MERKCSCGNFFDLRECSGICPECNKDIFNQSTQDNNVSKKPNNLNMKYRLINLDTTKEHLCDKVTINGSDYYVSDEIPKVGDWVIEYQKGDEIGELHFINGKYVLSVDIQKKTIATTNLNIDIPQVADEVEELADKYVKGQPIRNRSIANDEWNATGFVNGYKKSQETHPFSEEDVCDFVEWMNLHYRALEHTISLKGVKGTEDLLKLWNQQQPKKLYFK